MDRPRLTRRETERERARSTGGAQRSVAEQRRWRRLDVLHRLEKQRRRRLLHLLRLALAHQQALTHHQRPSLQH